MNLPEESSRPVLRGWQRRGWQSGEPGSIAAGIEDDEVATGAGGAHVGHDLLGVDEAGLGLEAQGHIVRAIGLKPDFTGTR